MPLLVSQRNPRILHKALAENPGFFIKVLTWVFKAEVEENEKALAENPDFFIKALTWFFKAEVEENEKDLEEITNTQEIRTQLGYQLLDSWQYLPGLRDNGGVDAKKLDMWIKRAREIAEDCHRRKICDSQIGRVLSYSPLGSHDQYPHESICELIENLESEELERGFFFGIINQRGEFSKSGGKQEYEIAKKYRNYAKTLEDKYPRTAKILEEVAASYERDAKREDNEVRLREDGFS